MGSRQRKTKQERRRRHAASTGRRIATVGGLTAGATIALTGVAQAAPATFTVAILGDTATASDCDLPTNTDCTLRDAITAANATTDADAIQFKSGLTGSIDLDSNLPKITDPVTIQGPGASVISVNGQNARRVFDILTTTDGDPVSISGLTVTGGLSSGSTASTRGGGILNENADLTVSDSVVSGNTGTILGGGIYSGCANFVCSIGTRGYSASLTLERSTVSGNTAGSGGSGAGGGLYLNYGGATIQDSTISGNHAARTGAGMCFFYMPDGVLIENSTVAGNVVTGVSNPRAGGIYIYSNTGGFTVSSSTIAGNSAAVAGGIYNNSGPGSGTPYVELTPVLHNSIVAGNTSVSGSSDLVTYNSSSFDSAFSVIGTTANAVINETVAGSDITGVNANLGPLASNGGPTQTMLPLAGSPAIDKGSNFGLTADQRALTRPIDLPDYKNSTAAGADGSDIGAVELQASPGGGDVTPVTPPATTPPTTPPKKKKCKKAKKGQASAAKKKCKKKKK
jgi:hypothetical protein